MSIGNIAKSFQGELLAKLQASAQSASGRINNSSASAGGGLGSAGMGDGLGKNSEKSSFIDYLKDGIENVNQMQKVADQKSTEVVTGKGTDIHDAMLASTQAELTFNLMVQLRNRALEAYQDVMRMPV